MSAKPAGQSPVPAGAWPYILAFLASPLVLVSWWLCAMVRRRTGRRWPLAAGAAAIGLLVVWIEGGPAAALGFHFSALGRLLSQFGQPVTRLPMPGAILLPQVPLSVPAGMMLAASTGHNDLTPTQFDPAAARRAEHAHRRRCTAARRRSARAPVRARAALAIRLAGELVSPWHAGRYIVLPPRMAGLSRIVVGRPGMGKSVYLLREVFLAALAGQRVILLDCKAEPGFAAEVEAAYRAGWQLRHGVAIEPSVHLWPDKPLCGWLGEPLEVVNKLLAAWDFTPESDWYREIAAQALRLALMAPGKPVTSTAELIRRMDAGVLKRLWADDKEALRQIAALSRHLDDVVTRTGKLMSILGANLDGPPDQAIGNADLTVLSLPVMAAPHDAEKIFRVVLADLAHYVVMRKQPGRELLVIDEFSAIPGGRESAIHISERGRSMGVATILAVQSERGLGDDLEADRLIGAAGFVVIFNTAEPDRLIRMAGTVHQLNVAAQVEQGDYTGRGTITMRQAARVDGNAVRQLDVGQAFILADNRAVLVHVLEPLRVSEDPRTAMRRVTERALNHRPAQPQLESGS